MSTAITPPTPENVAASLANNGGKYDHANPWFMLVEAAGNVVQIRVRSFGEKDSGQTATDFRAVVVEGDAVPLILDPERYAAEVISRVEWLVMALAHAPREDYPIHLAQFRSALLELAEAQTGGA